MADSEASVLILGASGMAGHVVSTYLRESGYTVTTAASRHPLDSSTHMVDVRRFQDVETLLATGGYDVVVNCVGALVAASDHAPPLAVALNSLLPHQLAHACASSGPRIIHLSTDCVFSGKTGPYREDSFRDGPGFYDRTKALGELENSKDVTLRTSIVGPEIRTPATGLFHWVMSSQGEVRGFTRSIWNGLTTLQLAKEIDELIRRHDIAGVVQPVPENSISKHDLVELISTTFRHENLTVTPVEGKDADKTLLQTRSDYHRTVPDFQLMLADLRDWMIGHAYLYTQYPQYRITTDQ
ncbi:sugar nucleotide-binding protein [Nocardioides sp. cx-169]|uniref:sugar nucleotide-binding protein n=1 Tax=Nocardioides sp. cx-169 TaxID=2899080 RepID=UPI001E3D6454|nr:sugar nucleotide-binding protein [Nocardioides sp. cx-169]MCD4533745.1 sugar nucleotide-binding protein [Nocardioides sp. cx-169]